ncbi:MAG TPA: FtsK/SpoIIIE domain-containing protein, partial [Acidimicrobiales bacterium]
LTSPGCAADWLWTRWLPHSVDPDDHDARLLATELAEACDLVAAAKESAGGDGTGPVDWWVVDGDDEALARTGSIRALLTDRAVPASGLVIAESRDHLPSTCTTVLEVDGHGAVHVQRFEPNAATVTATLVGCNTATAERVARRLAGLVDPELEGATARLPDRCALGPLLETEPVDAAILRRWARTAGTDELVVPIGADANGTVDVDLVRDGPHALIAGTTGSGKSELLRSLVVALAATADPEHCNIVLVDFKGGAAFDRLTALPHVVGCVTDLDERLAARALRCLEAELRRRERMLRDARASDITTYVRLRRDRPELEPLPRLVVVIDELATLVAELPDFVDALVDTAQRGRSLGVHLVLATQRPAGAVKESIRTNTNLRIALRVVEAADSRDVLGADDAARLPRNRPGRAVLRRGSGDVLAFQAAHVGGHTDTAAPPMVQATPWTPASTRASHAPVDDRDGPTDLDRFVDAIRAAFARSGCETPRRPWPDPLPSQIDAGALDDPAAFALVDEPDEQRCSSIGWDQASGNLLVAGLAGSGVTTTLTAVALAIVRSNGPDAAHVYAVTTDPDAFAPLAQTPHCGAVVSADDLERVVGLLRLLDDELRERRREGSRRAPLLVTLLDGVASLRAELEDAGLLDEVDLLERLVADGPTCRLVFAFGAEHPAAIGHRIERTAAHRVLLRLPERADYVQAGLHGVDPHDL